LELPPLDFTEADYRAEWRNAGFEMGGNLAAELSCRERQLMDALRRATEAEGRVKELEECLIVAGTVRDASYPSGWRNFRAESAEAKVQELQKQLDAANGTTEGR
jgi:hypothetical protein